MEFISIPWKSDWYRQEIILRDRVLRKPLGLILTADDLANEQSEGRFGIVDADELIACVLTVPLSATTTKLRQMAVLPERQRQGVGAMLVNETEAFLKEHGTYKIELNARSSAVGFYKGLGYQCVGDEFVEVSIPHFKMIKAL